MNHKTRDLRFVNQDLKRTKKLIVAIGDSFTYGSSAWDEELVELYPPIYKDYTIDYNFYDDAVKKKINQLYPETTSLRDNILSFTGMFQKNSYLSVLGEKLNNEWTCLNLGVSARGNFSAISSLFLAGVNWKLAEEVVVIFMPSSMNRVDVVNDTLNSYSSIPVDYFLTAWPSSIHTRGFRETNEATIRAHGTNDSPWNLFQDSIYDSLWSEKYEVLKTVLEFQFLKNWSELHNGKLIILPAFSSYYTREYFYNTVSQEVNRKQPSRELIQITENNIHRDSWYEYVDLMPWENFHHPEGYHSFYHYSLGQVDKNANNANMLELIGKPSKDNWIMACGHPSGKAHTLMADYLLQNVFKPGKQDIYNRIQRII